MDDLETCDLKTALKKTEEELDGIGYYTNLSHDDYARWIYAREYQYAVKDTWELVAVPQTKGVWEIY